MQVMPQVVVSLKPVSEKEREVVTSKGYKLEVREPKEEDILLTSNIEEVIKYTAFCDIAVIEGSKMCISSVFFSDLCGILNSVVRV